MTRAAIPDPPDEPCRDRETVRLPRSTSHEIQDLVDEGKYPNRSAVIRAGARLLIKCEREGVWPAFKRGRATADETASEQPAAEVTVETEAESAEVEAADANADADTDADADADAVEAATDSAADTADATDAEDAADASDETAAETDVVDVAADEVADAVSDGGGFEVVSESEAVSESDIVTKLSAVMREATAGERETAVSA